MKTPLFSYSTDRIRNPQHRNEAVTMEQLVERMKGKPHESFVKLRRMITEHRKKSGNKYPSSLIDSIEYKKVKESQPFFVAGGYCEIGHAKKNTKPSGFWQVDTDFKFDGGNVLAEVVCEALRDEPCVFFSVVSGSTYGVKTIVRIDIDNPLDYETKHFTTVLKNWVWSVLDDYLNFETLQKVKVDSLAFSQPCFVPFCKDFTPNMNPEPLEIKEAIKRHLRELEEEKTRRREYFESLPRLVGTDQTFDIAYCLNAAYNQAKNIGRGFSGEHQAHLAYTNLCKGYGIDVDTAWSYLNGRAVVGIKEKEFSRMYKTAKVDRIDPEKEFMEFYNSEENKKRQYEYMRAMNPTSKNYRLDKLSNAKTREDIEGIKHASPKERAYALELLRRRQLNAGKTILHWHESGFCDLPSEVREIPEEISIKEAYRTWIEYPMGEKLDFHEFRLALFAKENGVEVNEEGFITAFFSDD